jgi:hypothetical protein
VVAVGLCSQDGLRRLDLALPLPLTLSPSFPFGLGSVSLHNPGSQPRHCFPQSAEVEVRYTQTGLGLGDDRLFAIWRKG